MDIDNTLDTQPPGDEEQWPGVTRAYDFVMPSYQLLVNRYEAADGRLTQAISLSSTLLFGIPTFAKAVRPGISFQSPWFVVSLSLLVAAALVGIVARQRGRLRLVNPAHLYERWLHRGEWRFKKDMIFFAGADFDENAHAIALKARLAVVVNLLLVAALVTAAAWFAL